MNATMTELNRRVHAAIERSVAKGLTREVAFENHMKLLASEYPVIFCAYTKWLVCR